MYTDQGITERFDHQITRGMPNYVISDWSDEVVNLAAEFREDGVVGIDIAGGSEDPLVSVEHIAPPHIAAFTVMSFLLGC